MPISDRIPAGSRDERMQGSFRRQWMPEIRRLWVLIPTTNIGDIQNEAVIVDVIA
jgi:hypothetical protein